MSSATASATANPSSPATDYLEIGFDQIERDLRFLMDALGGVLNELGYTDLAEHLPWSGASSIGADPSAYPPRMGLAYSVAFQLLNMVEENTSAAMRYLREEDLGFSNERGLWGSQLARLKDQGITEEEIASHLGTVRVESVLTAHPTEAKRLAVLEHHRNLFAILEQRSQEDEPSPLTLRRQQAAVKAALERLWRTGEILLEKPTLADERRNVLYYLRDVFPVVLPVLDARLKLAWADAGFDPATLNKPGTLPRVCFGNWVGGDRDGHPGVTADVTRDTLERLRANALIVHSRNLTTLASKITLTTWMQTPPTGLLALHGQLAASLGEAAQPHLAANHEEPWRQTVEMMLARLPVTEVAGGQSRLITGPGLYQHASELLADLEVLRSALVESGAGRLAEADVAPVQRAVEIFGFHLAQLDVRQNSEFHAKALQQLLIASGLADGRDWEEWSEEERLTFLQKELLSPRPFLHSTAGSGAGPEADAVLGCYRVLAAHIQSYGAEGLGALIISMTRRLSDLLVVYVLAREAGLMINTAEGMLCQLPVVPLFETADDLENGPDMLRQFAEQPVTRRSLAFHAERAGRPTTLIQQVMVGYSDSNKDAGILASQWALHRAQSRLAEAGRDAGVKVCFFHGRGGTVSRGAGPMHRFLDALPHGSLSGDVRLTEQGETIAQKFANLPTAAYNLELLLAGVTATTCRHSKEGGPPHPLMPLAEKLASTSRTAYRALLEAEGFMAFYRQATPIDALEHSRIGSRPSRRTGQATLADLRAIPWVFSWNQCRFYVPGWYGTGSGLASLTEDEFEQLARELKTWPYLNYVITNIEASLASTDRDLMTAYAGLVEDDTLRERLFGQVMQEWELTTHMLDKLRGGSLQSLRPRMWKTLELRAEALRVLHHQQIALLKEWRGLHKSGNESAAMAMLPDVLLSINAIASGLRTTG